MIITKTPFRMSFFGGGTDFEDFYRQHGGTVLSATFDKYCYVMLCSLPPFFDYRSEFAYSRIERVREIDEIEHPAIREAMRHYGVEHVRLTYEADLPARTGLGTSSSFAVGLIHGIHASRKEVCDKAALAEEAIHLERVLCRECGGVQDQIAAAFGGFNRIDLDGDGFRVTPVAITPERKQALQDRLMLFFTGFSRFSAELQTAHQSALEKKTADLLAMKEMASTAQAILEGTASLDDFGRLLHEAWQIKRGITDRISNSAIDTLYERAVAAGALGGKLLGAGGGGFLLFYAPEERHPAIRAALGGLIEVPFAFEHEGSTVLFNNQTDSI